MKFDRRLKALMITGAVCALATVAAQAQPTPPSTPPRSDPANQLPPQEPVPAEVPPPAPGETPAVVPPGAGPTPVTAPPVDDEDKKPSGDKASKAAEVVEPPAPTEKRARHGSAIIQALDKITAETMRFEAKVGRPVRYKGLVFTVRSCETSAGDEPMPDSMAYLEVRSEPKAQTEEQPSKQVFRGWMFASSPGLNGLQHPVYDAWLIACKA
jgi:hypothetical protein